MNVVTVVGARPQFVKAAVVSRALAVAGIAEVLVHTGQHYDESMSAVFFEELGIPPPAHNLGVGSGSHASQTAEAMRRLEPLLQEVAPELVLVYGDTNSTLAAALTAAKLNLRLAHVEAGLRSFNRRMPEEINRIVTDRLSDLLFCPTSAAVANLAAEGISAGVMRTGDVMYDAALFFRQAAAERSSVVRRLGLQRGGYILATVHRAENTDEQPRLAAIVEALGRLAREQPVVLPLHPRTAKMLKVSGLESGLRDVRVVEPVGFLDMVQLESESRLIVTDSGGVQKEAYFHGVPCVTLRGETEWVETVAAGWNTLADTSSAEAILSAVERSGRTARRAIDEYGDGAAAERIASALGKCLGRATGGKGGAQ